MDFDNIVRLKDGGHWTEFLSALPGGKHTFRFPSTNAMKSCKAIGYDINSEKKGRRYTFSMDKENLILTIKVEVSENNE